MTRRPAAGLIVVIVALLAGCGRQSAQEVGPAGPPALEVGPAGWVDQEVDFDAGGLRIHGTYRHIPGDRGPAAVLISESGATDRNGDNAVAGPVGNMRQLADYLSEHGVATLRYDKIGTGATGLGPYAGRTERIGSAVYTEGAAAAAGFLAGRPDTGTVSAYALGEGAVHAMALAAGSGPAAPPIHSLALLQPLADRYLDLISRRVEAELAAAVRSGAKTAGQADQVRSRWQAAVEQVRTLRTAPADLPDGLSAILNPGNAAAVAEADAIDPLRLAAGIPAGTPVLLTCSDSDAQADCATVAPLAEALAHTALQFVRLTGVNHVLRDDPTDNIANYPRQDPLSPQLTAALDEFVTR